MPVANIHIGAGKCGSSLIQGLLNEPDAREIMPARYLPEVCKIIQTHTPIFDFSDPFIQKIVDDINGLLPKEDILLSVENVFGVMTHRPNCCDVSAQVLKRMFKGFDIRLLMFVRRQDGYIESVYNQDVKRQELRTFDEYYKELILGNLDWLKIAETYSVFDLTVMPFEKKVLKTVGYRDFVDVLFRWMGQRVEVENLPVINASLSPGGLAVQFVANQLLPTQTAYDLSRWLEKHAAKKPDEKHELLQDREAVIGFFKESNETLFKRFMGDFSPDYYLGRT